MPLQKLTELKIQNNTKNIRYISLLRGLKKLEIKGVSTDDFIEISKITNLETLIIGFNRNGIFNTCNNLINLKELVIESFMEIIPDFSNLKKLKSLTMAIYIHELPDSFFDLDLEYLNLERPFSFLEYKKSNFHLISKMKNLKYLNISHQNIKYLPPISARVIAVGTPLSCICCNDIENYDPNDLLTTDDCQILCRFRCKYFMNKFLLARIKHHFK